MNNRGQAYSTFKLLIAAIVALAMLMILLPIISSVLGILQNDPNDKVRELLNNLYNQPEAVKTTDDITFTPNYVLSAASLSQKIPLGKEQICMSLGPFETDEENGFSLATDPHHKITWNGKTNKVVKAVVTCNIDLQSLEESINDAKPFSDWDEPDCSICEDKGRCCLISLKAA